MEKAFQMEMNFLPLLVKTAEGKEIIISITQIIKSPVERNPQFCPIIFFF
jgi:hypothetical protein